MNENKKLVNGDRIIKGHHVEKVCIETGWRWSTYDTKRNCSVYFSNLKEVKQWILKTGPGCLWSYSKQ